MKLNHLSMKLWITIGVGQGLMPLNKEQLFKFDYTRCSGSNDQLNFW